MIKQVKPDIPVITLICDVCGDESDRPIRRKQLTFIEEFQEYENYPLDACPTCGAVEVLNMNLPEDETDLACEMTQEEWDTRHLIKNIKKYALSVTQTLSTSYPPYK